MQVKRMAEIRGQSKEEIATRKNLAEEMKREIDAKTESYNLDREKTDIANRVEAPCLGKNTMAAANALSAANMALAGFDHLIPFDEVLVAMDQVGRSLPHALRCTGLGGLSITETSRAIEEKLKQKKNA